MFLIFQTRNVSFFRINVAFKKSSLFRQNVSSNIFFSFSETIRFWHSCPPQKCSQCNGIKGFAERQHHTQNPFQTKVLFNYPGTDRFNQAKYCHGFHNFWCDLDSFDCILVQLDLLSFKLGLVALQMISMKTGLFCQHFDWLKRSK